MKRPCFNYLDRLVIRQWYDNLPKSSFRRWWDKPLVVSIYESAKAQKTLLLELYKTKLFRILITIITFIEYYEKTKDNRPA